MLLFCLHHATMIFIFQSIQDEVKKLLYTTLSKREREIIRLYHGIDSECHTWEDIGKR